MTALTIHASPACDISIPLASLVHPFDGRKYSRALRLLQRQHPAELAACLRPIAGPMTEDELRLVHTSDYLASLRCSRTVAGILEVAPLRWLPSPLVRRWILRPMLVAAAGTRDAALAALASGGTAVCLGGGFHHAHADHGEGFCIYADVPLAFRILVARGLLAAGDEALVIDLDAHRGNGFESACHDDPVHFLDLYNVQTYPGLDDSQPGRHPHLIPLRAGTDDAAYLAVLAEHLPAFLDRHARARIAFFNAGTDIFAGDQLGRQAVSAEGVLRRDVMVLDELRRRRLPTVMVTSGGYSDESHRLIARTVSHLLGRGVA